MVFSTTKQALMLFLLFVLMACGEGKFEPKIAGYEKATVDTELSVANFIINDGKLFTNSRSVSLQVKNQIPEMKSLRIGYRQLLAGTSSLTEGDCQFGDWFVPESRNFSYEIPNSVSEGEMQICAQLGIAATPDEQIVTQGLVLDEQNPIVISLNAPNFGRNSLTSLTHIELKGKLVDNLSGVTKFALSLQDEKSNKCYDPQRADGFHANCPYWIDIAPQELWTYQIPTLILTNGDFYSLASLATDEAGNVSSAEKFSRFRWMSSSSVSADFVINEDAIYTLSENVTIKLLADNLIDSYRLVEGINCDGGSWQAFTANNFSFLLSLSEGTKNLCLQTRDQAGEMSLPVLKSITLDRTAPTSDFNVAVTLGPMSTPGADTTFSGTASDATSGVSSVHLTFRNTANNKYLDGANFDSDNPVWVLATGNATWSYSLGDAVLSDGVTYEISSRATDAATNLQSILASHSFTWASTAPNPAFAINAGVAYANVPDVILTLTDATDVAEYRKANGNDCSAASWVAYTGAIAHTLPASDGAKEVCLEVRDLFLNTSTTATDSITLDQTLPASTFTVADTLGPDSTPGTYTTVSGTASDATSGVSAVQIAFRNTANNKYLDGAEFDSDSPVWYLTTGTTTWAYDLDDALLAEGVTYEISSRATDGATNEQTPISTDSFSWFSLTNALNNAPSGRSNIPTLAVLIGGTNATHYKYKVGASAGTNCADSAGYSSELAISNPISDSVSAIPDGSITLCVVRKISEVWEDYASSHVATWTKTMAYQSVLLTQPSSDYFCAGQNSYIVSGYCRFDNSKIHFDGSIPATETTCLNHSFTKTLDLSSLPNGEFTLNLRHGLEGGEQGYLTMTGVKNISETYGNIVNFPSGLPAEATCRGHTYLSGVEIPAGVASGNLHVSNGGIDTNSLAVSADDVDLPNPFKYGTDLNDSESVSGAITSNTTWNTNKRVTGLVTVNAGITLTIASGVTIFVDNGQKILVHGAINAVGDQSQPIYVVGSSLTPATDILSGGTNGSTAVGFELSPIGNNSIFQYAVFANLANGIHINYNNHAYPIPQGAYTLTTTISNSVFFDNSRGIYFESYPSASPYSGWTITGSGNLNSNAFISNYHGALINFYSGASTCVHSYTLNSNSFIGNAYGYYSSVGTWWIGTSYGNSVFRNNFVKQNLFGVYLANGAAGDNSGSRTYHNPVVEYNFFLRNRTQMKSELFTKSNTTANQQNVTLRFNKFQEAGEVNYQIMRSLGTFGSFSPTFTSNVFLDTNKYGIENTVAAWSGITANDNYWGATPAEWDDGPQSTQYLNVTISSSKSSASTPLLGHISPGFMTSGREAVLHGANFQSGDP